MRQNGINDACARILLTHYTGSTATALRSLHLEDNVINVLPIEFQTSGWQKLQDLYLKGNPLRAPPIDSCSTPDDLRTYLKDLKDDGDMAQPTISIFLLGFGGVGKSTVRQMLSSMSQQQDQTAMLAFRTYLEGNDAGMSMPAIKIPLSTYGLFLFQITCAATYPSGPRSRY